MGLAEGQLRAQKFVVASLAYRYRLMQLPPTIGRAVYSIIRFDTGDVWSDPDNPDESDWRYGAGVGLGADTAIGPLYFGYGVADQGANRFYLSLGTMF